MDPALWKWLCSNWPNLAVQIAIFLTMLRISMKIHAFLQSVENLQRRSDRHFNYCLKKNSADAGDLLIDKKE